MKKPVNEYDQLSPQLFLEHRVFQNFYMSPALNTIRPKDDPDVEHKFNSLGYRGPEVEKAPEILVIGCSQTFGMGVEYKDTWGSVLENLTGMSHLNMGIPGSTNQEIIESAIAYINKNDKPKVVCALLPSIYRFNFTLRHDILTAKYRYREQKLEEIKQVSLSQVSLYPGEENLVTDASRPLLSKRPHDVRDVLPYESILYMTMVSINHLIEFCKVANIKLLISTWYPDAHKVYKKRVEIDQDFANYYINIDNLDLLINEPENATYCHNGLVKPKNWYRGLDIAQHMGVHSHLHYAEMFASAIEEWRNREQ